MSDALKPLLAALARGETPEATAVDAAFAAVMDGEATQAQIGALLMGLSPSMREPSVIAAGARALRARMTPVAAPAGAIDVCGTGGDGAQTLNVSTAAAFVLAGCGVTVAKHGNRAMSSRAGAADVLEGLGVNLTAPVATLERALREAGVAFLFAPSHHPAMRHVGPARKELGFRTVFNVLGPLCNPGRVSRQLVGVFDSAWLQPLALALQSLEAEAAWVVHGAGGLDEVSLEGPTRIVALRDGAVDAFSLGADDFGLAPVPVAAIKGGDAPDNARLLRRLLEEGRDAHPAFAAYVVANAAAALVMAGRAGSVREAAKMAEASLVDRRALQALDALIDISRSVAA